MGGEHLLISILTSNLPGLIRASSIRSGLLVIPGEQKMGKNRKWQVGMAGLWVCDLFFACLLNPLNMAQIGDKQHFEFRLFGEHWKNTDWEKNKRKKMGIIPKDETLSF